MDQQDEPTARAGERKSFYFLEHLSAVSFIPGAVLTGISLPKCCGGYFLGKAAHFEVLFLR